MTLQDAVGVQIAYKTEATFGTAPSGATGGFLMRRVSSSLNLNKDTFTSNEVRSDQQVADVRHGGRSIRGNIEGELSVTTYDKWFEKLLRNSFAAGVSASPTDFATSVTAVNSTSSFDFVGAGSLITIGFKTGDIVTTSGIAGGNNPMQFVVTAVAPTQLSVDPAPFDIGPLASGWTVDVRGQKLLTGTDKGSFTIEQVYPDLDLSELFVGCRMNGVSINLPPTGMATCTWDIMGIDGSILTTSASPYFVTPGAETTTGVLTGVDGTVMVGNVALGICTGAQLNITNNQNLTPVIGSVFSPDVFFGRMVITGNVSVFMADEVIINYFVNETPVDIVLVAKGIDNGQATEFLSFSMQGVKLLTPTKTIAAEGGVIAQFPFQATLQMAHANVDGVTLVIQSST